MPEQSVPDTERFARQLKKGVLEMVVLRLLAGQPSHGYELIQRLRRGSGGMLDLKEGTLYPILYRLQGAGLIQSRLAPSGANGGSKKYYSLTEKGRETLAELLQFWAAYSACVQGFVTAYREKEESK